MPLRRLLAPALLLAVLPLPASAGALAARVDPRLLSARAPVTVFVHAGTTEAAATAALQAGLEIVERYRQVGIVVATGSPAAVLAAARARGVTYLEDAEVPITFALDTAGKATRNTQAQKVIRATGGAKLSGRGVSVAVVDTGIDGTHPFFGVDGPRKVVANLKNVCTDLGAIVVPNPGTTCWVPVAGNDTDSGSAGGHGTHVAGIVAGVPTTVTNRLSGASRTLTGAAPGASLVGLSVGNGLSINGGTSGLNWVLDNHTAPCGSGVSAASCPPIRVVNNSWGAVGGSAFDPESARVKVQRALVAQGVVVVWAAGNDGGDGSGTDTETHAQKQLTNGPGNDPTPGILMVAAYDDGGTGSSDASLASYSSRGVKGQPSTYPDLSAPGSGITSACRATLAICSDGLDPWDGPRPEDVGTFNTLSGTSMATPYVAGVVAELFALDPTLTPAAIERLLEDGAHRFADGYEADPTNPGTPTSFDKGHGLIDVLASADLLQQRKPRGLTKACGTAAWTDAADDATGAAFAGNTAQNHPAADLRSGRWEWDGRKLTAVFVIADVTSDGWRTGESGTYVNWRVRIGDSASVFALVGEAGSSPIFYMSDDNETTLTHPLKGAVVDLPGTGSDEIRVFLDNSDLATFGPAAPTLGKGVRLVTGDVSGAYRLPVSFVTADTAVGGCPVVLTR